MNARLAIALIALGVGCARESDGGVSSDVLEVLAAHRSPDMDPEGEWLSMDGQDTRLLSVRREHRGRWTLRSQVLRTRGASEPGPSQAEVVQGELSDGILTLESLLDGSTRLHLCRFGGDDFLLPENTVRFEGASASRPEGAVYQRIEDDFETFTSPTSVVEPLPAGMWEAVACPEWTWLEIRPTGADGSYRVRCSRRQGDYPTPINSFSRATWEADVLALDAPLFGNASWCLRWLAEEDWLVPRARKLAEEGDLPEPAGMRFRLVNRVTRPMGHISTWDGVDFQ